MIMENDWAQLIICHDKIFPRYSILSCGLASCKFLASKVCRSIWAFIQNPWRQETDQRQSFLLILWVSVLHILPNSQQVITHCNVDLCNYLCLCNCSVVLWTPVWSSPRPLLVFQKNAFCKAVVEDTKTFYYSKWFHYKRLNKFLKQQDNLVFIWIYSNRKRSCRDCF